MKPLLPPAAHFCVAFLDPSERALATHELASHGTAALPVLRSILDGSARNESGAAYRKLGMPLDCALVTAGILGKIALPLEDLVRAEAAAGHPYAEEALLAMTKNQE